MMSSTPLILWGLPILLAGVVRIDITSGKRWIWGDGYNGVIWSFRSEYIGPWQYQYLTAAISQWSGDRQAFADDRLSDYRENGLFFKDTVTSDEGDDTIRAGAGDDRVYGGGGADTILVVVMADILYGQDGNDTISGGNEEDTIYGGLGNDEILGGQGDDVLQG